MERHVEESREMGRQMEGLNPVSNSISTFNKESDLITQEHSVHFTEKSIVIAYFASQF